MLIPVVNLRWTVGLVLSPQYSDRKDDQQLTPAPVLTRPVDVEETPCPFTSNNSQCGQGIGDTIDAAVLARLSFQAKLCVFSEQIISAFPNHLLNTPVAYMWGLAESLPVVRDSLDRGMLRAKVLGFLCTKRARRCVGLVVQS